jgi:hypothetical protein
MSLRNSKIEVEKRVKYLPLCFLLYSGSWLLRKIMLIALCLRRYFGAEWHALQWRRFPQRQTSTSSWYELKSLSWIYVRIPSLVHTTEQETDISAERVFLHRYLVISSVAITDIAQVAHKESSLPVKNSNSSKFHISMVLSAIGAGIQFLWGAKITCRYPR